MIGEDKTKTKQDILREEAKKYITQDFNTTASQILNILQKSSAYQKFSYIVWLQTSRLMGNIIQNAQSKIPKAIQILQFIKFFSDAFFVKLSNHDNIDFIQKVYKQDGVKEIAEKEKNKIQNQNGKKQVPQKLHSFALQVAQFEEELKQKKKIDKKKFNKLVKNILSYSSNINHIYDEICFNWIRTKCQKIRNDENNLCCQAILYKQEILMTENNFQEFKNYKLPIEADSLIKDYLVKTIIGFLNKNGGIIYNGIHLDSYKKALLNGSAITTFEIKNFFQYISRLIKDNIYPKHKQFQERPTEKTAGFNSIRDVREINHYISFEYDCLVNPQEFTNLKEGNKSVYLIKICIKPGHSQHLYHLINQQKKLQYYVREEKTTNKKKLIEAQQLIVQRTLNYINYGDTKNFLPFHSGCRYSQDTQA